MLLGHSARRFATTADLIRGWSALVADGSPTPKSNPVSARFYRKFLERARGETRYFGRLDAADGWRGLFFKQIKFPRRWSRASQMQFSIEDWKTAWPDLL